MAANTDTTASTPNYAVKQVDQIVKGTDVLVRLFTLAPSDVIPWHYHSESTDHYFVLSGTLGISIRDPEADHILASGEHWHIAPGRPHLIRNGGSEDCRFLLIQGVGKHDFITAPRG
jgi:quercetin dioxygenase-like cupin family protein